MARDIADAAVPDVSADNRLGSAYEAVLVSCKLVVHASGYRVRSGVAGAHAHTLECAGLVLGPSVAGFVNYFDGVRRRRNTLSYDVAGTVSDHEAAEALRRAISFGQEVEAWIRANHAHLA